MPQALVFGHYYYIFHWLPGSLVQLTIPQNAPIFFWRTCPLRLLHLFYVSLSYHLPIHYPPVPLAIQNPDNLLNLITPDERLVDRDGQNFPSFTCCMKWWKSRDLFFFKKNATMPYKYNLTRGKSTMSGLDISRSLENGSAINPVVL